jgi:hypothetical protein
MAQTKTVKFVRPVGMGAVRFSAGATAELPEVWADRFIKDGAAVEAASEKPAAKPKAEKPAAKKPAKSKKK